MNLVWDFNLHVVALTKDTRNAADEVYGSQARAAWQFNGSGAINPKGPLNGPPSVDIANNVEATTDTEVR